MVGKSAMEGPYFDLGNPFSLNAYGEMDKPSYLDVPLMLKHSTHGLA